MGPKGGLWGVGRGDVPPPGKFLEFRFLRIEKKIPPRGAAYLL